MNGFRPDNLSPILDLKVMYSLDLRNIRRHIIEHSKLDKFFIMAFITTFEISQSRFGSEVKSGKKEKVFLSWTLSASNLLILEEEH